MESEQDVRREFAACAWRDSGVRPTMGSEAGGGERARSWEALCAAAVPPCEVQGDEAPSACGPAPGDSGGIRGEHAATLRGTSAAPCDSVAVPGGPGGAPREDDAQGKDGLCAAGLPLGKWLNDDGVVPMREAKTHLSRLAAYVNSTGESITVARGGVPWIELRPLAYGRAPAATDKAAQSAAHKTAAGAA